MAKAKNPGSINDTLQNQSDTIVFAAYIVQNAGQIVTWEDEFVAYEHDLI